MFANHHPQQMPDESPDHRASLGNEFERGAVVAVELWGVLFVSTIVVALLRDFVPGLDTVVSWLISRNGFTMASLAIFATGTAVAARKAGLLGVVGFVAANGALALLIRTLA